MADGTGKVVLAAMAGNLAIAAVKFVAFFFTRSTAMLTEAIHSCVDTIDQVLLLIGQGRGCVQTRGAWRDALCNEFEGRRRCSVRQKDPGQKRGG